MSDEKSEAVAAPEKSFLRKAWDSKYLAAVRVPFNFAKAVTSPVWWPAAKIGQVGLWGLRGQSTFRKTVVPLFSAAALTTYVGGAVYGGVYTYVSSADTSLPGVNWPASRGSWTGHIVRLSEKGTFPCNHWEGVLQTGGVTTDPDGASTNSYAFSIRKFQWDMIAKAKSANENNTLITMHYADSPIEPETFQGSDALSCIQYTDHTPRDIVPVPRQR